MGDFEIVDRPLVVSSTYGKHAAFIAAVLEASAAGRAVFVRGDNRERSLRLNAVALHVGRRGIKVAVRTRKTDNGFHIWVEPKP